MVAGTDWLGRVAAIRAWRRGGERAPHKPLLLLYALGRLQRLGVNSPVAFSDAEGPLRALLGEFGPPRATSPGYPFHHLATDGLWVVRPPQGSPSPGTNLGRLRAGAEGRLEDSFAAALSSDPALLVTVARYLLEANFPSTLHADIAASVGLDLTMTASPTAPVVDQVSRRRRDPRFREDVLLAYESRCAMCGWDGSLGGDAVGVEAAHIRWFTIDGPDELANGVCLCALHHKLLDTGAIGLTPDLTIAVSLRFVGHGSEARRLVYDLIDRPLDAPQTGLPGPAVHHVAWHAAQVFRGPARRAA